MSFDWFKTLVLESTTCLDPSVDKKRREVLIDAIKQTDTLEELGLLSVMPGLRWSPLPENQTLILIGHSAVVFILVVTRLPLAHPNVLKHQHILPRDATLYSVMGGFGDGHEWYPIPHSIGRCKVDDTSLEWLDNMSHIKDRKYGLLHRLHWQRPDCDMSSSLSSPSSSSSKPKLTKERIQLAYTTYSGDSINVGADTLSPTDTSILHWAFVKDNKPSKRYRATGLLPYRNCSLDYWSAEIKTPTDGLFYPLLKHFYTTSLPQWVNASWRLKGAPRWESVRGLVAGPVLEHDKPVTEDSTTGWQLEVVSTATNISDTSGRSMFFPTEYTLKNTQHNTTWTLRSDYKNSVVYLPNGNMDWLGSGLVFDQNNREIGVCVLEAHHLQSMDEILGTTLQLAGFIDRRDDDRSNDWELFRP